MFNVRKFTVGQMASNAYVAWDDTDEAIIVDPGDDANTIIEFITSNQLTPRLMIATHGHFDHVMAAFEIKLAFSIPFYIHPDDEFLLKRVRQTSIHYLGYDSGPNPDIDFYLQDKMEIKIGNSVYKTIHTPGHTPGSICLINESAKFAFVGDLIFDDGSVGRTDFSYASEKDLKKSLRTIFKLPGDFIALSGHGEEFSLSSLKSNL